MSSEGKDKVCLKAIAPRLVDLMRELGTSSTESVVTMLINKIVVETQCSISQDTVKRRIYDVINVLSAAGIIEKNGKKLIWHGLDALNQISEGPPGGPSESESERLTVIKEKENILCQKIKTLVLTKTLIQRNTLISRPEHSFGLNPLIIIGFPGNDSVKITSEDRSSLTLTGEQPCLYMSPSDILSKLPVEKELLEKMINKHPLFSRYADRVIDPK